MKKKTIVLFIILLCFSISLGALSTEKRVQPLIGYLYGEISFSVDLLEEVLPFNLASEEVAENTSPFSIAGLRIGVYSLIASNVNFKLYVTHDKLVLKERVFGIEDEKTLSAIDYRLYMETGDSGSFQSCLSESYPDLDTYTNLSTAFTNLILLSGSTVNYTNQGIYVSLEDHTEQTTEATVEALKAGMYASDIFFYLETGD